jgi:heat shock protein HslJ
MRHRNHRGRALTLLVVPLAAITMLAACGSDGSSSATTNPTETTVPASTADLSTLDGRVFVSTEVVGYDLVKGTKIKLAFSKGTLAASGGCNAMSGPYTIKGDTLIAPTMASTMMACDQALMDQDTWLSGVLSGKPTLALEGDTLTITGSGSTITLVEQAATPLEGTRWEVTGLVANQAISTIPIGTQASLTITDGTAAVETGCNTGSAKVTITDTTITFGPLALTRKACPQPETDLENAVVATLTGDVTYKIRDDKLSLRTTGADGKEIGLELQAAPS